METFLTPTNIVFVSFMVSTLFSVYLYFKNPQVENDKIEALFSQRLQNHIERVNELFSLTNNQIQTIDIRVETLNISVNEIGIKIAKLATIIDERIPKK